MSEEGNLYEKDLSLSVEELWEQLNRHESAVCHRDSNPHCTEDMEVIDLATTALTYFETEMVELRETLKTAKERELALLQEMAVLKADPAHRDAAVISLENYSKHLDQVMLPGWMTTVKDYDLIKNKTRPAKMMQIYLEMKGILMQKFFCDEE